MLQKCSSTILEALEWRSKQLQEASRLQGWLVLNWTCVVRSQVSVQTCRNEKQWRAHQNPSKWSEPFYGPSKWLNIHLTLMIWVYNSKSIWSSLAMAQRDGYPDPSSYLGWKSMVATWKIIPLIRIYGDTYDKSTKIYRNPLIHWLSIDRWDIYILYLLIGDRAMIHDIQVYAAIASTCPFALPAPSRRRCVRQNFVAEIGKFRWISLWDIYGKSMGNGFSYWNMESYCDEQWEIYGKTDGKWMGIQWMEWSVVFLDEPLLFLLNLLESLMEG